MAQKMNDDQRTIWKRENSLQRTFSSIKNHRESGRG